MEVQVVTGLLLGLPQTLANRGGGGGGASSPAGLSGAVTPWYNLISSARLTYLQLLRMIMDLPFSLMHELDTPNSLRGQMHHTHDVTGQIGAQPPFPHMRMVWPRCLNFLKASQIPNHIGKQLVVWLCLGSMTAMTSLTCSCSWQTLCPVRQPTHVLFWEVV